MACPDRWHPHLHKGSWHPLRRHDDEETDRLACPICHPIVGTAEFERHAASLRNESQAMAGSRQRRGAG
jgi:hypothetical protein